MKQIKPVLFKCTPSILLSKKRLRENVFEVCALFEYTKISEIKYFVITNLPASVKPHHTLTDWLQLNKPNIFCALSF